jgi:hypothetical protein
VPGLPTIRRALLVIGAVALVWALAVEWTGGFFWQIGSFRPRGGLLRQALDRIGVVTGYHKFTGIGRLFVVDLEQPSTEPPPIPAEPGDAAETAEILDGCVAIEPARRW